MKISNTELAELILTRLYELAESSGYYSFWNIREIAKEFNETDVQKIFNIVKYLESYGLVSPIYALGGFVQAQITGQGSIFVENGGKTGIIAEYKKDPSVFIITENSNSNIVINSKNVSQQLSTEDKNKLIDKIKYSINYNSDLTIEQKENYLNDIESLNSQLRKSIPNKKIISAIIESLRELQNLSGFLDLLDVELK